MRLRKLFICGAIMGLWALTAYAQTAPALALKDAIPVVEKALEASGNDTSHYYLYGITLSNSSKGPYWYFTYRPSVPSEYGQIFVKAYMDGTTEITGGSASRARR